MKPQSDNHGFTIIELLIAVSLFLVLLTPLYALLHTGIQSYQKAETRINHQQSLRIAMEAISQDLRECKGLAAKAESVSLDQNNLLLKTAEGDIIRYHLKDQNLRWAKMQKGGKIFLGNNPVAEGITVLRFGYNRLPFEDSTQVTIWLQGVDEMEHPYELGSTVYLRLD